MPSLPASYYHGLLDALPSTGVIATDAAGRIAVFNQAAEELLGYRADEVIGQMSPLDLHVPEELAERITMLGIEVEGVQKLGGEFEGIVVAQILASDRARATAAWLIAHRIPASRIMIATPGSGRSIALVTMSFTGDPVRKQP